MLEFKLCKRVERLAMPRRLRKKRRRSLSNFLRRHVFHVRCDSPLMPERIRHLAEAITSELVFQRHIYLRAGGHCTRKYLVRILDVEEQIDSRRSRIAGRGRSHFVV
jgi:hypothetical protein